LKLSVVVFYRKYFKLIHLVLLSMYRY